MSAWIRIRFFFGVVVVFLIVGLLVLYLNAALSTVRAQKAELGADTTTIGVDYPGLVADQRVSEGDRVHKGQTLFVVTSPQLAANLANRTVTVSSLPFKLDRAGDILVTANDDGVVEKVDYLKGSYVPGGAVMATLDTASTLYISGHFHLTPPDYARLKKGASMDVTFPDNSRAQATVYSIALAQDGDIVDTVVKARLHDGTAADFRFPVGTPVEASLSLTKRTWWQSTFHFINKLFKPAAA